MIKILFIAPYPLLGTPIKGGVEAVTFNLMEGFRDMSDVEIKVLSICHKEDKMIQLATNVSIRYLKSVNPHKKIELAHVKDVVKTINKEWNPDFIHIQGNGSNFLLYDDSYQNKLVITQHGVLIKEIRQIRTLRNILNFAAAIIIEQLYSSKVKRWVFISRYNMRLNDKLIKSGIHSAQIYNPVNPKYFVDCPMPDVKGGYNLLFVGGIRPRKGLLDLLVGIYKSNNKNIHLDVVGGFDTTAYMNQIMAYIKNHNLTDQITFHGWQTSEEIIKLYKNIHALALPSRQETLPCAIAEAMACGKIVLASNICGIPEMVVPDETGYLFEPQNTNDIASVLKRVCSLSNDEIAAMSNKAQKRAEQLYNPRLVAKQHIDFYLKILGRDKD